MDNLRRLGKGFAISVPVDNKGLTGRRCPNPECLGFFKIAFGTGLKGEGLQCHCPYCGHQAEQREFTTPEQLEYVKSIAERKVLDAIYRDFKKLEFSIKPKGNFGIGFSMKLQRPRVPAIKYYHEDELETEIVCSHCTLRYAIYGVFAFCPDCVTHNSLQILSANLDLIEKQIDLAEREGGDLGRQLIDDGIENAVSSFDAFGREVCKNLANRNPAHAALASISFQNLEGARSRIQKELSIDIASLIDANSWSELIIRFQMRHLLSHCLGVVDKAYIEKTGDTTTQVGHKIQVTSEDVSMAVRILRELGDELAEAMR